MHSNSENSPKIQAALAKRIVDVYSAGAFRGLEPYPILQICGPYYMSGRIS
jgi:hypothetical protein